MAATAVLASGWSIAFGTSSFEAEILYKNYSFSGSRAKVDTSHQLTTGGRTYVPGTLVEYEMGFSILYDPSVTIPIEAVLETITLTDPDDGTHAYSGFITEFSVTGDHEELYTADITVAITGSPTIGTGSGS